ncbi:MAG: hypothetical protein WC565_09745 [Parcubacteria group bacterium]|jgi:hypothetical protein
MAFDWKGTFNRSQYERFKAYAQAQLTGIQERLNHLNAEIRRVGRFQLSYDQNGIPTAYSVDPDDSYIGKLMGVYEILGGDAFYDLKVRTVDQPVFMIKGSESSPAQLMSSGEAFGPPGLGDRFSAIYMEKARSWIGDSLQSRREYLERKIRRLIDYTDQLEAERQELVRIAASSEVEDSLAYIFTTLEQLFDDPTYRAVYDDGGSDPQGQLTSAPLAAYNPGPERAVGDYGRGPDGAFKPGEVK